jgi:hypothetical protein
VEKDEHGLVDGDQTSRRGLVGKKTCFSERLVQILPVLMLIAPKVFMEDCCIIDCAADVCQEFVKHARGNLVTWTILHHKRADPKNGELSLTSIRMHFRAT